MDDIKLLNMLREAVWNHYIVHGRHDLPWRLPDSDSHFNPYKVLVSELMLQQTQVSRVIPKYVSFLDQFPNVQTLAQAPLSDVLRAWSGLGYNRRAKYLKQACEQIVEDYGGVFPEEAYELVKLPGVGRNTAGAIVTYAFNKPEVFIETNIRTVYIHHFFSDSSEVSDKTIAALVAETLDLENPREWYWALMDYGSWLKGKGIKLNALSKSYNRQSTFDGSRRQIRGQVLRQLLEKPSDLTSLSNSFPDRRLVSVLDDLIKEGLIHKNGSTYSIGAS